MFQKIINYIKESKIELKKVAWPTKQEAINHTLLVIGMSIGMAIFIGIADYILTFGFEQLIER